MPQFYKDANYRQVDGPNAQKYYFPVPLHTLREVVSNDFGGTATDAVAMIVNANSTPDLQWVNGDTDSTHRLSWAASNADAVTFQVPLPPWVDTEAAVTVYMQAAMGGTTDSLVVAADTFAGLGDTKVEDNSGTVSGTALAEYSITIAASDIPLGTRSLSIELTPGAHTTDTFLLYDLWVEATLLP